MGFLSSLKAAFSSSLIAQFLGEEGVALVLYPDHIERRWVGQSTQHSESQQIKNVTARMSEDGLAIMVSAESSETAEAFEWRVALSNERSAPSEALLFVNRINRAARGPNYSLDTFIHER